MLQSMSGPARLAAFVLIATAATTYSPAAMAAMAASKVRVLTLLVQQDFSDCVNSNVVAAKPAILGGEAQVTLRPDGQTSVNVRLTKVAPNTTYHLFLKCQTLLGDIATDAQGRGNNTFMFPTSAGGSVYAFDMYPDGAPLGNKYQSVQVSFK